MVIGNKGGDHMGDGKDTSPPNILVGGRKGKCLPTDCPFSKIFRTFSIWINWITALVESLECRCIVSHCYNLQKNPYVVICIFYLFHGQCLLLHGRPN